MKADIQKLTDLSLIRIDASEIGQLTEDLSQVLSLADQLHPVQEAGTRFPSVCLSALREDMATVSENAENLMMQSCHYRNPFVQVARIVTESC